MTTMSFYYRKTLSPPCHVLSKIEVQLS
jgi:hypothetical protein